MSHYRSYVSRLAHNATPSGSYHEHLGPWCVCDVSQPGCCCCCDGTKYLVNIDRIALYALKEPHIVAVRGSQTYNHNPSHVQAMYQPIPPTLSGHGCNSNVHKQNQENSSTTAPLQPKTDQALLGVCQTSSCVSRGHVSHRARQTPHTSTTHTKIRSVVIVPRHLQAQQQFPSRCVLRSQSTSQSPCKCTRVFVPRPLECSSVRCSAQPGGWRSTQHHAHHSCTTPSSRQQHALHGSCLLGHMSAVYLLGPACSVPRWLAPPAWQPVVVWPSTPGPASCPCCSSPCRGLPQNYGPRRCGSRLWCRPW